MIAKNSRFESKERRARMPWMPGGRIETATRPACSWLELLAIPITAITFGPPLCAGFSGRKPSTFLSSVCEPSAARTARA